VTRRGYHCRGQPGSAQGKPALLDRQNPNWLPSKFVVAGSGGSLEISRSVQSGEKPKIAEVNLLRLTGSLIYRWRRDPQARLADVLRRINDHPAARLAELLPWNWKHPPAKLAA
jgi:hypothetical protein